MPPFPLRFFNPGELEKLVTLLEWVKPKTVIELGCQEGRAAATILLNMPDIAEYVGVDVFPGYQTQMQVQRNEVPAVPGLYARDEPRFRLLLSKRGTFDFSLNLLPPCEAVFIDADHSRDGVLNDYMLAKSCVQPGGIIIFHDDNGLPAVQVSETLDYLAEKGSSIVHVKDSWLAYERIKS